MDSLSQSEAENVPLSDLMDLGSDLPSEQRRKHRQSFYQHKCEQCQRQRNGCVSDAMSGYSSKTFEPMSTHRGHRDSPAVGVRQRFSQIFTEENKPRLLTYARYAIIFLIGFALGLVPFIKQYVDNCEANREIIDKLIEEHRALHNISLITGTASAFTGPKLVRRTALAIGNKEIRLYCSGAIQIEGVEAFGVSGKLETIRRFNAYCKSHIKYEKNMNQCDVSLARVYGTNFPQVDSVTKVTYLCREKKR